MVKTEINLEEIAMGIRYSVLDVCLKQGGGYLSQACSTADLLALLYAKHMHLGKSQGEMIPRKFPGVPSAKGNHFNGGIYHGAKTAEHDRFILSPSHYAQAIYSALIQVGRLAPEGLEDFNPNYALE